MVPRFRSLILELQRLFPMSSYLCELLDDTLNFSVRDQIQAYDTCMDALDENSFFLLRKQAIERFQLKPDAQRGNTPMFDILNNAMGYAYLLSRGYTKIECLEESNKIKSPDLKFTVGTTEAFCEVKTIHISDFENRRIGLDKSYNTRVYERLPQRFLNGKLKTILQKAIAQLGNSPHSLIFIVMHIDDIAGSHLTTYETQLHQYLSDNWPSSVIHIQYGVTGMRHWDFCQDENLR